MRQVPIDKGQPRSEDHKEGVDTHERVTVLEVRVELHKEKVRGDFTGASGVHLNVTRSQERQDGEVCVRGSSHHTSVPDHLDGELTSYLWGC